MRAPLTWIAALVLALSGCGTVSVGTSTAVWELAPDQVVDAEATSLTVLVTRLACNSGVTGSVNAPTVDRSDDEIVITFTVSPGDPPAANCQGNDLVEYVLELNESVGGRALIDGACRTTEAAQTTFCNSERR